MQTHRRKRSLRATRDTRLPAPKARANWKRRDAKKVTEALNAVYSKEDSSLDPFLQRAAVMTLMREDW